LVSVLSFNKEFVGDRTNHRNLKDIECKKNKENAHIEFKDIALKLGLGLG
jgi:hypothetical protein